MRLKRKRKRKDGKICEGMSGEDVQSMPLRNIWCHSGVTHLVFAKARASSLYAPVSNVPPSSIPRQSECSS